MAEKLNVKMGDMLHLTGETGTKLYGVVLSASNETISVMADAPMMSDTAVGIGILTVKWDGSEYRTRNGKVTKIDLPVIAKAILKKTHTEDGILEVAGPVGKVFQVDMMTMESIEYGHLDHPGKRWQRISALFTDNEGNGGMMPVELFDIITN